MNWTQSNDTGMVYPSTPPEPPKPEIPVSDGFYFDRDELAFSSVDDHARGKVYQAGKAFDVKPGYVRVIDMATGESEIVPANASGSRPLDRDDSGVRVSYRSPYQADGSGVSPFVVLKGDEEVA